jgi:hypothetical protein
VIGAGAVVAEGIGTVVDAAGTPGSVGETVVVVVVVVVVLLSGAMSMLALSVPLSR